MAMDTYCAVADCSKLSSTRRILKGVIQDITTTVSVDLCSVHKNNMPPGDYVVQAVAVMKGDERESKEV